MKDEYDFTKAVRKNPYAERMKNGYTIIIERGPDTDEKPVKKDVKLTETQKQSAVQA